VQEFIDHILAFFEKHPFTPLRIFVASRVEEHIRGSLETDGVLLGNLDSHSPQEDIEKFLQAAFEATAKRDRVIQAYARAHGEWPGKPRINKLVKHIGGSFVLASTIFKYIVQPATTEDTLTPMERLPLTFSMNGLDDLYAQTLSRSQHLPHFRIIISTIALLRHALPIIGIANLLGIQAFEVVHVLLNLQAIIHVPGTDDKGVVTFCHSSLRDFLTTESRSGPFFASPRFHLCLSYYCFASFFKEVNLRAYSYGQAYLNDHCRRSFAFSKSILSNEIEEFTTCQRLFVGGMPSHTFLCSMFFYSIVRKGRPTSDRSWYILTECTKHLALAVECPDSRIQHWMERGLYYGSFGPCMHTVQFTKQTFQILQQHLERASIAIHANVRFRHPFFCCGLSHNYNV
jgi:hypothetical protein